MPDPSAHPCYHYGPPYPDHAAAVVVAQATRRRTGWYALPMDADVWQHRDHFHVRNPFDRLARLRWVRASQLELDA